MILQENDLQFNFTDAIDAYKFDEQDKANPHYHGLDCFKKVDFVVELSSAFLFVEVKDPLIPGATPGGLKKFYDKYYSGYLFDSIVGKMKDSFLYRWAEIGVPKPIYYLTLLNTNEPWLNRFQDSVREKLPVGKAGPRWADSILAGCHVIDLNTWNRNFTKWPVSRMSAAASSTP